MNVLKLEDDGSVEREVKLARVETLRAALAATTALPQQEMAEMLRRRYEVLLHRAEADLSNGGAAPNASGLDGRSARVDAANVPGGVETYAIVSSSCTDTPLNAAGDEAGTIFDTTTRFSGDLESPVALGSEHPAATSIAKKMKRPARFIVGIPGQWERM